MELINPKNQLNILQQVKDLKHQLSQTIKTVKNQQHHTYLSQQQSQDLDRWMENIEHQLHRFSVQVDSNQEIHSMSDPCSQKLNKYVHKVFQRVNQLKQLISQPQNSRKPPEVNHQTHGSMNHRVKPIRMQSLDYNLKGGLITSLENMRSVDNLKVNKRSSSGSYQGTQMGAQLNLPNTRKSRTNALDKNNSTENNTKPAHLLSNQDLALPNSSSYPQLTSQSLTPQAVNKYQRPHMTVNSVSSLDSFPDENVRSKVNEHQLKYHQDLKKVWDEVQKEKQYNQQLETKIQNLMSQEKHKRQSSNGEGLEAEMARMKSLLQEQAFHYRAKKQKIKEKVRHIKDRYKGKIDEYEKYIAQLKVNMASAQIESQNSSTEYLLVHISQILGVDISSESILINELTKVINELQDNRNLIRQLQSQNMELAENVKGLEQSNKSWKLYVNEMQRHQNNLRLQQENISLNRRQVGKETLEITKRFDKLKQEIQKHVKSPDSHSHQSYEKDQKSSHENLKEMQLRQKEQELETREKRLIEQELIQAQHLRKSLQTLDREHKQHLRESIEKERIDWHEKSLITSSELVKYQNMLEEVSAKLVNKDTLGVREVQMQVELIKTQINELSEFHKRLKEMSPIPQHQMRYGSPEKASPEIKLRTRAFKLGAAKDHPGVESSSCFETLHELCNIQIEELKKSLKSSNSRNDTLQEELDDCRDKYQMLLNEKMELDVLYSTKINEVAYLNKYLEDYEKEINGLKTQFEQQVTKLNRDKEEVMQKLDKFRQKKQLLQSKLDSQIHALSSKDNSIYIGGGVQSNYTQLNEEILTSQASLQRKIESDRYQHLVRQSHSTKDLKEDNVRFVDGNHLLLSPPSQNYKLFINSQASSPANGGSQQVVVPQNHQRPSQPVKPLQLGKTLTITVQDTQETSLQRDSQRQNDSRRQQLETEDDDFQEEEEEDDKSTSQHQLKLVNSQEDRMERRIDDIRKIIRYEEVHYQGNNSNTMGNSQTVISTDGTPVLTPQNQIYQALGHHPQTSALTTRSQRKNQKELVTGNLTTKVNPLKVFTFGSPRNYQDDNN